MENSFQVKRLTLHSASFAMLYPSSDSLINSIWNGLRIMGYNQIRVKPLWPKGPSLIFALPEAQVEIENYSGNEILFSGIPFFKSKSYKSIISENLSKLQINQVLLNSFHGPASIIFYDKNKFFLGTDISGGIPLYEYKSPDQRIIATSPFLISGAISAKPDKVGIFQLCAWHTILDGRTLWEGVKAWRGGQWWLLERTGTEQEGICEATAEFQNLEEAKAASLDYLRTIIGDAINSGLKPITPVTGGWDSAVLLSTVLYHKLEPNAYCYVPGAEIDASWIKKMVEATGIKIRQIPRRELYDEGSAKWASIISGGEFDLSAAHIVKGEAHPEGYFGLTGLYGETVRNAWADCYYHRFMLKHLGLEKYLERRFLSEKILKKFPAKYRAQAKEVLQEAMKVHLKSLTEERPLAALAEGYAKTVAPRTDGPGLMIRAYVGKNIAPFCGGPFLTAGIKYPELGNNAALHRFILKENSSILWRTMKNRSGRVDGPTLRKYYYKIKSKVKSRNQISVSKSSSYQKNYEDYIYLWPSIIPLLEKLEEKKYDDEIF